MCGCVDVWMDVCLCACVGAWGYTCKPPLLVAMPPPSLLVASARTRSQSADQTAQTCQLYVCVIPYDMGPYTLIASVVYS